jgi:ABC-type sugar transport system ATPase subunit
VSVYILELKNIVKRFSGVEVLHQVPFQLRPGEAHALLGENCAGKSTFIKMMRDFHQPEEGEIFSNGALLDSLGVQLDLKQKARNLRIAQQQMVEIAHAISMLRDGLYVDTVW